MRSGFRWRHPDELLAEMPLEWWRDWRAYDRLEPIGDARGDWLHARLLQTIGSIFGGQRSTGDYLPKWGGDEDDEFVEFLADIAERRREETGG